MAEQENNRYGQGPSPEQLASAKERLAKLLAFVQNGQKVTIPTRCLFQDKDFTKNHVQQLRAQIERSMGRTDEDFRAALLTGPNASDYVNELNRVAGAEGDTAEVALAKREKLVATLTRKNVLDDMFTFTEGQKPRDSWGVRFKVGDNIYKKMINRSTTTLKVNFIRDVRQSELKNPETGRTRLSNSVGLALTVGSDSTQADGFPHSQDFGDFKANLDPEMQAKAVKVMRDAGFTDEQLAGQVRVMASELSYQQFQDLQTPAAMGGQNIGPELLDSLSPEDQAEAARLDDILNKKDTSQYVKNAKGEPSESLTEQKLLKLMTGNLLDQNTLLNIPTSALVRSAVRAEARNQAFIHDADRQGVPTFMAIQGPRVTMMTSGAESSRKQEIARNRAAKVASSAAKGLAERLGKRRAASREAAGYDTGAGA